MSNKFELGDYVDVATRIAVAREHYPEGSLQPVDPTQPYRIEDIGETTWIVYTAAFFRWPDDPRPGIGVAWEPFPGRTPYTHGSELQNAETSAWGRAIVAALAADTRSGVASADEVVMARRRAEEVAHPPLTPEARDNLTAMLEELPEANREALRSEWKERIQRGELKGLSAMRSDDYPLVLEMIARHTPPIGALVDHGAVGHRAVERTPDPTLEEHLDQEERLELANGDPQPAVEVDPPPPVEVEPRPSPRKKKKADEPVQVLDAAAEVLEAAAAGLDPCEVCGLPVTVPNDECPSGEHAF